MRKLAVALVLCAGVVCAQTAELHVFRAVMLPDNETPPVTMDASAVTTLYVHIIRDNAGKMTSAPSIS